MLSTDWIDACLEAWQYVAEGPYQLAVAGVQPVQQPPQQQQVQQKPAPQQHQQQASNGAGAGAATVGAQRQQQLLSPVATGSGLSGVNIPPSDQSALLQLTQQQKQKLTQQQEVSQPRQQPVVPQQQLAAAAVVDQQVPITGTVPVEFDGLEPLLEADLAVVGDYTHRIRGRGEQTTHQRGLPGMTGGTVAPAAAVGSDADEGRSAGTVDEAADAAAAADDVDDGGDSSDETVASEEENDAEVGDDVQVGTDLYHCVTAIPASCVLSSACGALYPGLADMVVNTCV